MFSVAVATVLFPALSRLAARRDLAGLRALTGNGMRQIALLLIPSAAAFARARDADRPARLRARRVRRRVDPPGDRGAVLVLVLAALLGHQPAAHAHVLLAPAAVAADAPRARLAGRQRRRLARALRAARDRRHRDRHDRRERVHDAGCCVPPARASWAASRSPRTLRAAAIMLAAARCSAASPTASGGGARRAARALAAAQIVSVGAGARRSAAPCTRRRAAALGAARGAPDRRPVRAAGCGRAS